MRQTAVQFETNRLQFEGVVAQPDDMAEPVPGENGQKAMT